MQLPPPLPPLAVRPKLLLIFQVLGNLFQQLPRIPLRLSLLPPLASRLRLQIWTIARPRTTLMILFLRPISLVGGSINQRPSRPVPLESMTLLPAVARLKGLPRVVVPPHLLNTLE
jgi:hypothetical protein